MARPTFTIITVTRNQASLLRGALESVLAQGVEGVQHLVIDGCSTDETSSLVSRYPHATLIVEPFMNESEALNAALARASGEVVSFLAPGDRYASGAFDVVAAEIQRHPIVLGSCECMSAAGEVLDVDHNVERTWYDSMKYWVARAIPARPGVFFKRSILTELEIDGGAAFDEGLRHVADVDLWLRLQERYPFSLHIDQTLASSRRDCVSDSSARQRELSRVFRRHCSRRIHPEQLLSFVIPVVGSCEGIGPFVDSIAFQDLPGIEVVLVDAMATAESFERMSEECSRWESRHKNLSFQRVSLHGESVGRASALERGARAARSLFVASVSPERALPASFALDVIRAFSRDEIGLLLPCLDSGVVEELFTFRHGTPLFNPSGPFSLSSLASFDFVARKVAWLDCGRGVSPEKLFEEEFTHKRLMVMMAHKAWRIVHEPLLPAPSPTTEASQDEPFRLYVNSLVVDELAQELRRNPFSTSRSVQGYGLLLSDELWQVAHEIVQRIPVLSIRDSGECSSADLRELADTQPAYGPAIYLLAKALEQEGKSSEAQAMKERWAKIHDNEKGSPLFGRALDSLRRSH